MAPAEPSIEQGHPVPVPAWLVRLCRAVATSGGLVLLAMMAMTVASVVRRTLLGAPIPGDFELVEVASALIVVCFLPWCQIERGNVLVDFFTMKASPRTSHALEALGDLLYLGIGALLTWRLVHGGLDLAANGEQTMILRMPIWWAFLVIVPAMALLVVTTAFTLAGHLRVARA